MERRKDFVTGLREALGRAKPDLELRMVWYQQGNGRFCRYEFLAVTSFGQEWITDVLELRGTGDTAKKLVVNGKDNATLTTKLALDEGLAVMSVAAGAR